MIRYSFPPPGDGSTTTKTSRNYIQTYEYPWLDPNLHAKRLEYELKQAKAEVKEWRDKCLSQSSSDSTKHQKKRKSVYC